MEFTNVPIMVCKMGEINKHTYFYLVNSLNKGGAERQVLTLQREFGGEIILIENTIEYLVDASVKIHALNNQVALSFFAKLFRYFDTIWKLRTLIKKQSKEENIIVISFLEQSNVLNIITSLFTKHHTVISARINLVTQYKNYPWFLFIIKYLYRFANRVTANSKGLVDQMKNDFKIPSSKVHYVSNAYDVDLIIMRSNEKLTDPSLEQLIQSHKFLLSVNRLEEQKLVKSQIEIFTSLKKQNEGLKLIIAGQGPLRQELIRLSKKLGNLVFDSESGQVLTSKFDIYFVGLINNPFRLYKYTSGFLLTSYFESMPNSLIEALICKAPVFASDCPFGPREILRIGEPNYMQSLSELKSDELIGTLLPIPQDGNKEWIHAINHQINLKDKNKESVDYKNKIESFKAHNAIESWRNVISF